MSSLTTVQPLCQNSCRKHGQLSPTLSTVRTFLNFIKCTVIYGEVRSDLVQRKHGHLPARRASQHVFLLEYIYHAFILPQMRVICIEYGQQPQKEPSSIRNDQYNSLRAPKTRSERDFLLL